MQESLLFIITGSRGAGKTTFCAQLVQAARKAGWQASGLLSLAVYEGQTRTQLNAEDIKTGEAHILATRITGAPETSVPTTKHWQFVPETVTWGNQVLQAATQDKSDLAAAMWDASGALKDHIKVYINGRQSVHLPKELETLLNADDSLDVFPPVGGGA